MGYAVQDCFRRTPGVHFIAIIVSLSRSSCMVFYFIIFYNVRRGWCFSPSGECSDRKLTKTLLWYVAPTHKYVKRVIYFSLFLAMQAPKPEKMRVFHRKDLFECICGRKWRVTILYVSVLQWRFRTPRSPRLVHL